MAVSERLEWKKAAEKTPSEINAGPGAWYDSPDTCMKWEGICSCRCLSCLEYDNALIPGPNTQASYSALYLGLSYKSKPTSKSTSHERKSPGLVGSCKVLLVSAGREKAACIRLVQILTKQIFMQFYKKNKKRPLKHYLEQILEQILEPSPRLVSRPSQG